jgi:mono/diheme cytochrome c family protein
VVIAGVAGRRPRSVGAAVDPATPAFYSEKVRPILMTNCGKCHFNYNHKGGLAMDTRASMMKGGRDGRVVVPGDPANSTLVKLMRHQGPPNDPKPMPPKSPRMSDADIAIVEQWIKAGAAMPENGR